MNIKESVLINLLEKFHPFTYELHAARYPFPLPGLSVPLSPPETNNCCTFVEALLVKAWADTHPEFKWGSKRHGQMMILSADDFFSPVTAVIESGMGSVMDDTDIKPWTVVQGWRGKWNGGHTFIIVDHHEETDRVLTLESNSAYNLDGVGFRGIGNLRDFNNPPVEWWKQEDLWTWERIKSAYKFRKQAALNMNELSWGGLNV
jgi:hypothetical protein